MIDPEFLKDSDFWTIVDVVYRHAGITLGETKKNLVISRLSRRLRTLGFASFSEYTRHLKNKKQSPDEIRHLINAITTNTTQFFREAHHFVFLEKYLRSRVALAPRAQKKRLRIWCAASSTGQEPYSIAITLSKVFKGRSDWDIKPLATDIDTNALTKASAGEYTPVEMNNISEADRSRFFHYRAQAGNYKIKPFVRNIVVFRRLNLIYDSLNFNEPIDICFCRNVMIYFSSENRMKLLAKIHRTLSEDGMLFLGHSESIPVAHRDFKYLDTTVYRKRCVQSGAFND